MLFEPVEGFGENEEKAEETLKKRGREKGAAQTDAWQQLCGQLTCAEADQVCTYDYAVQKLTCVTATFETEKLKKTITRSFCFGMLGRGCFCAV